MNETIQTILTRRSVRAYQPRQIDDKDMQEILRAGHYAPSAMGQQPWHFTIVQNPDLLDELQTLCKTSFQLSDNATMREMASSEDFHVFYHAPTLVIVSGDSKAIAPLWDSVLAMGNMLLAAQSLGIASCWQHAPITIYGSPNGAASLSRIGLNFPKGYVPYAAAVFGYGVRPLPEAAPRKPDTETFLK
jgi:nitroreductase